MFNKLLNKLCPSRAIVPALELAIANYVTDIEQQRKLIQKLEDIIANKKTIAATTVDKLSVSSHAIHRYRERHKGKGTDDDISKMLYKALLEQLASMDTLPDGKYPLRKGVIGVVKDNTLVTVLPRSAVRATIPTKGSLI